jgi:hypothetical protein
MLTCQEFRDKYAKPGIVDKVTEPVMHMVHCWSCGEWYKAKPEDKSLYPIGRVRPLDLLEDYETP